MPATTDFSDSLADLEKLPSFPIDTSSIQEGQYVIESAESIKYESPDNQFNAQIWFKSPPLDRNVIKQIDQVQLYTESHDQGFAEEPSGGNWTWFELAILEDESDTTPKIKDGIELIWRSHRNRFMTTEFGWKTGSEFGANHDMLHLLEEGNVIAVRVCARFPGWTISANRGLLVITIGSGIRLMSVHRPDYASIVTHVETVHEVLDAVNMQSKVAFMPKIPENIFRADMMGSTTDRPLRVLSLDGGGVRGLASLKILQAIMIKGAPGKEPWEIFDMIGGTSTGGLIAIMLGRLRMSIKETMKQYGLFMDEIFGESGILKSIGKGVSMLTSGEQYDASVLEGIIRKVVKEKTKDENTKLLEDQVEGQPRPCKVFCMATRMDAANNRGPMFLRSYRNPQEISLLPDVKIWEAARATSAAPTYFKPIKIGKYELVDGGLGANNPLGWLWTEVLGVFGPARPTDCFLSIGTGIPPNQTLAGTGIISGLSGAATNTQIIHILFRTLLNAFAPRPMGKKYFRLNIGEETGNLGNDIEDLHSYKETGDLDDTGALKELLKMTDTYLDVQKDLIEECAKTLGSTL